MREERDCWEEDEATREEAARQYWSQLSTWGRLRLRLKYLFHSRETIERKTKATIEAVKILRDVEERERREEAKKRNQE